MGFDGLYPAWCQRHGWKVTELNEGFLKSPNFRPSSKPCLMTPEGKYFEKSIDVTRLGELRQKGETR